MTETRKAAGEATLIVAIRVPVEVDVPSTATREEAEALLSQVSLSSAEKAALMRKRLDSLDPDEDFGYLEEGEIDLDESYQEIPKVTAFFESDMCLSVEPNQITGEIDATGYLEQASDDEIKALIDKDLGGDYEADAIYHHVAALNAAKPENERDPEINEMERRIAGEVSEDSDEDVEIPDDARGFEVHVDKAEFEAWLLARRPHLMHRIADVEPDAPKVTVSIASHDKSVTGQFDISRYLEKEDDGSIEELLDDPDSWGAAVDYDHPIWGFYQAAIEAGQPAAKDVSDYVNSNIDPEGDIIDLELNRDELVAWISERRPHLKHLTEEDKPGL